MTGDFTSVPLRGSDRWVATRMQQGRVLLDTDWNLNIDGPARDARQLAVDTIGPFGVPVGSSAFEVNYSGGDFTVSAGSIWIGGMLARNPDDLGYHDQPEIDPLPDGGLALIYLDAFVEEVQAAEDPADLLDPALDGVDTTTRQRIGWRVRATPAKSRTCTTEGLPQGTGTGVLDVTRTGPAVATDPCAPPDDPRSKLPDGLLRIEVLDAGDETTARFAWSYADGSEAVAGRVAGTAVTLVPSPAVTFAQGDLVEISTLARREDRRDHGSLFTVADVTPQAGGAIVTLDNPSPLAGNPPGTCLRRWDGQSVGAAGGVAATFAGADVGIEFTAHAGNYLVGDWWGVRVRGSASDAVETLSAAPPDGVVHAIAPLAIVDVGKHEVLSDCRPTFPSLTSIRGGTCTVTAFPGDDLQAAIRRLPASGGELCLAAGVYEVRAPVLIEGKNRIVVTGVGPATILRSAAHELVLGAIGCNDIEVKDLRVEAAHPRDPSGPPGDKHLLGALSMFGCAGVRIHDCEVYCPDSTGRAQSGIYVAPTSENVLPDRVTIAGNRLEIGDQQTGILVVSSAETEIRDNAVRLSEPPTREPRIITRLAADEFGRYVASHIVDENEKSGTAVALPGGDSIKVSGRTQIKRLTTELAGRATEDEIKKAGSAREALMKFARLSALDPEKAGLSKANISLLLDAVRAVRSVGQGIVVGGELAGRLRVEGNEVSGAIQGIHVGVGAAGGPSTSGQVVIAGNTIESVVPFFWSRQRHAIYVGSSASTTLLDNHAHLSRGLTQKYAELRATAVEAVRIWGRLGPWLQVRGVDLTGAFDVGVHIVDTSPPESLKRSPRAVRYVSDVLNLDGRHGVVAPSYVATERCVP